MLISRDSKPNSVEEEREKPTTKPENPLPFKTKINSTPKNTDLSQESPTQKSSAKSSMPPSKVTDPSVYLRGARSLIV